MRLPRTKRLRHVSLAVVLAVVLAACGDGRDDDEGAGGGGTTEETGGGGAGDGGFAIDTADCLTDPASVAIEGDTIKLGTSLPQSGQYAAFNNINLGQQAYFRYLNEELGGVDVGGTRYKVELVVRNDEYAADKTVANVTSLVEDDGVFALFNVVGTKNNLAIRDYVNENCVPDLFAATGSPAWGNHAYPWLLGTFLVPYPLEMQALVTYLEENDPDAKIAILRANDDFGRAYSETLEALVEGTDLTIVAEETYDPESTEVGSQVTSLASSGADVWVLGATLLPCPLGLNKAAEAGWRPLTYMSGTCTSKTLMDAAGANGDGVISVAPLMDPNDPQWAQNEAMVLYKEKIAQYGEGADPGNGIVAYGWTVAALFEELMSRVEEPTRLGVMQAARELSDVQGVGLQLPGATWSVGEDDWFLGENFNLVQYSAADGYFKVLGEMQKLDDETEEITPESLING